MSLFGLGKKKEEVKVEPACACNGEVATYEASSCCCGGQQVENCCGGDNKVTSIKVLGAGCKSCHDHRSCCKKCHCFCCFSHNNFSSLTLAGTDSLLLPFLK